MRPVIPAIRSKVRVFTGPGAWHYVTVGKRVSKMLQTEFDGLHRGWRSLPVRVTIGSSTWNTSIFYMSKWQDYLLGLNVRVRKRENTKAGDRISFTIEVRDI